MKINVDSSVTKNIYSRLTIIVVIGLGLTKKHLKLDKIRQCSQLAVNSSVTKKIYSRLYAEGTKSVETSCLPMRDSPFFMLQRYWQQDDELSLSEELQ
tara:strand:- start:1142 stop:1435 length:294 start_codon:yes stop_codon:yes gene_type:complete